VSARRPKILSRPFPTPRQSIAKVWPFIEAEGWRPTSLTERADLGAWLKRGDAQLELFAG
jgi:hypothetical protein